MYTIGAMLSGLREKIEYFRAHPFVRNAAILQVGNTFGNFLQAIGGIFIARMLQPEAFGIYALSFGLAGLINIFLGLGAQDAVITILSGAYVRKDQEQIHEAYAFLGKITFFAGCIALLGAGLAPLIAQYFYGNYLIGVYGGIIIIASIIASTLYSFAMNGLQLVGNIRGMTLLGLLDQLSRTGFAVLFVLVGFGVLGVMLGHLTGATIVFLTSFFVWRHLRREFSILPGLRSLFRHSISVPIRKYFGFSFWIAVDKNLANLYNILSIMLLGLYVSTSEVTFFKLAFGYINLAISFLGPIGLLLNVEFPKMKEMNSPRLAHNFMRVSLYSFGLSFILTVGAVIVAPFAFRLLYGPNFEASIRYVYGLIPYGAIMGMGIGLGSMLRALNKVVFSIKLHIVTLSLGIPLGLLFIKNWGAWGAVAIVSIWYIEIILVAFFYILRRLKSVQHEQY